MEEGRGSVEFTGLKQLEPIEQTIVKGIAQEYLPIIQRQVNNNFDLLVHVKSHKKSPDASMSDKRTKYAVHLKLIYANNNIFNVDKVHDWDLPKGVHESFVALMNVIKKNFKNDSTKFAQRKSTQKSEKQIKRREVQISKDKKKQTIRREALKKKNRTY